MTLVLDLRDQAQSVADDLLQSVSDARAVLIATEDGFELACAQRENIEPDRIAAMSGSISAISLAICEDASMGVARCVIIEAVQGFMVLRRARMSTGFVTITVLTRRENLLGMVVKAINDAAVVLAQ
jgi:predicted regulator of Ras-like GTPase activity (Roadblock/LC7/MglB family)